MQIKRRNYEEMISLLMHHIFITINRYVTEKRTVNIDTINEIEKAAHFFRENYNKPISVEQYAKDHLINMNKFIRDFKKNMNLSPMQYIISLRITNAKGYLENTNKNIAEIANIVGYDNPLYFSRLFRKYTGFSPSEYKKRK